MFFFGSHSAGDGDGTGDAAHRPSGSQRGAQPPVKPEFFAGVENNQESGNGNDGGLDNSHRPGPDDQGERQGGPQQDDTCLDVVFHPETRVHPFRQANQVGDQHAQDQGHQRRFQVVMVGLIPGADHKNDDGEYINEDEGR
jgi:hypothetical protein